MQSLAVLVPYINVGCRITCSTYLFPDNVYAFIYIYIYSTIQLRNDFGLVNHYKQMLH